MIPLLNLSNIRRPLVMGIVNVTPDSFSDGGLFFQTQAAIEHGLQLVAAGADLIDIGGESTRPHDAESVTLQQELDRVIPVIIGIRQRSDITISIDTSKSEVMCAAVQAGAGMINDVRALQLPGAIAAAAQCKVPVCLMHMQGDPRTMQAAPHYQNVILDIIEFFQQRVAACEVAGITNDLILLDPGFGFGKSVTHNLQLIKHMRCFTDLGYPVVIGVSRKSTIGKVLAREVDQRLYGSLALTVMASELGVKIVRTHDVAATVDALQITQAVLEVDSII